MICLRIRAISLPNGLDIALAFRFPTAWGHVLTIGSNHGCGFCLGRNLALALAHAKIPLATSICDAHAREADEHLQAQPGYVNLDFHSSRQGRLMAPGQLKKTATPEEKKCTEKCAEE